MLLEVNKINVLDNIIHFKTKSIFFGFLENALQWIRINFIQLLNRLYSDFLPQKIHFLDFKIYFFGLRNCIVKNADFYTVNFTE